MVKEFALYKGEDILALGIIREIADELGVQRQTIDYYKTQAYQNRLKRRGAINGNVKMLVEIEDD